jgi:hypothetical protein
LVAAPQPVRCQHPQVAPFCAAVDLVVAAIIAVEIAASDNLQG